MNGRASRRTSECEALAAAACCGPRPPVADCRGTSVPRGRLFCVQNFQRRFLSPPTDTAVPAWQTGFFCGTQKRRSSCLAVARAVHDAEGGDVSTPSHTCSRPTLRHLQKKKTAAYGVHGCKWRGTDGSSVSWRAHSGLFAGGVGGREDFFAAGLACAAPCMRAQKKQNTKNRKSQRKGKRKKQNKERREKKQKTMPEVGVV